MQLLPFMAVPQAADSTPDTLIGHCGASPGVLCRLSWDTFHNGTLAEGADYFLAKPATIILIIVLALVIRALAHRTITRLVRHTAVGGLPDRLTERLGLDTTSPLVAERRRQRAETMGSVFRNLASFAIFSVAFVMALGELGLDLAPVIASAGILGVALGFGAQNLVKDFLSGTFMILEDQFGVGDVIDVKEATGVVEAVSLRTTRLRDVNGVVWHVRNGEIMRIGNYSQGWSRALVDVSVAYGEDIPRVRAALKATADELWHDPQWSDSVIAEPEVWGVETLSSDAVVVRIAIKTTPSTRAAVARELRERAKATLEREGIAVPLPQRSVWVASGEPPAASSPASPG